MSLEAWGDDGDDDGLGDMREAHRQTLLEDGWLDDESAERLANKVLDLERALSAAEERGKEMRKALKPFAEIGAWLFARNLPDDTPVVDIKGLNGAATAFTRGDFKRAYTALYPETVAARTALTAKGEAK